MIDNIRNSGAAFLGNHTPVALGDYAAGPSHVLPTRGTCSWAAGLCSNSFLRSGSITEFNAEALDSIAEDVVRLATKEGLTAHAKACRFVPVNKNIITCSSAIVHLQNLQSTFICRIFIKPPLKSMVNRSMYRPAVTALSGYVPGEQPPPGKFIKLNTNENPYPPPQPVVDAIKKAAFRWHS